MGNWFSEGSRGIAMGAFSSSANGGNVLGSGLALLVLVGFGASWPLVTFLSAVIMAVIALLFFLFGRDKPTGATQFYIHGDAYIPVGDSEDPDVSEEESES
jgi:sugar phosphate permease